MMSFVVALLLALLGPSAPQSQVPDRAFVHLANRVLAQTVDLQHLPTGQGIAPAPGLVMPVSADRLYLFDEVVADLSGAGECDAACVQQVVARLRATWLELVVEASAFGSEIPSRVHFAASAQFPAASLIATAYVVAQSRPVAPPDMDLLVNLPGRGLRAQPFHLMPPEGLDLRPGAGALAPTVHVRADGFVVDSLDAAFSGLQVNGPTKLRAVFEKMKKKYPGKQVIILRPHADVSLQQLMQVVETAREEFPVVVFGPPDASQD